MGRYCSKACSNRARRRALADRFWAMVDRRGPDECWPFTGPLDADGYGLITSEDGRQLRAPRVAYALQVGAIPAGKHVLHGCDSPPCCNGAHLHAGTVLDNNREKAARGRSTKGRAQPWSAEHRKRHMESQQRRRARERAPSAVIVEG